MIIFLYGLDSYRLKQNQEKIVAEYKKKHENGLAFYSLDFSDNPNTELEKFDNILKTVSFFNEKQLIVLKNAFVSSDKIIELIKKWNLAGDKEKIIVISENGSEAGLNKKSKKLFALLSMNHPPTGGLVKSFDLLAGKQLENWVTKEAEIAGAKFEPAAARKLVEFAGNDSWRLAVEIEKLANHARGLAAAGNAADAIGRITEKDVELLVSPAVDLNIFEAIEAIASKNRGRAMYFLNKHLSNGEDPYYLFSMVIYQFRNLLRVKSLADNLIGAVVTPDAIARKTGLHPFVAKKAVEQARKFELSELKQKFTSLADYDVAIKNGGIDIVDCLYQIALS